MDGQLWLCEVSAVVTDLISKIVFLFVHAIVITAFIEFGDWLDAVNFEQWPTSLHALIIIFLKLKFCYFSETMSQQFCKKTTTKKQLDIDF